MSVPEPPSLNLGDPRTELRDRVQDALLALPSYFDSATNIEGLAATDLFSLNTVLGATIEVQVVQTLNRMRDVWDPNDEWTLYQFYRQAQTFPDVLFKRRNNTGGYDIALGVELKGWYMLAKEREPSFRYCVTPGACSDWDLLVVIPWYLSNVLSGVPRVSTPTCWSAKYIAEYRNYWWSHIRKTGQDSSIESPSEVFPYMGRDNTSDKPVKDGGGNFGRIARTGIMDDWIQEVLAEPLAGIPAEAWIDFLKRHESM
ncbi:hypothetical protein [Candidatus Poriferisocius sp.]|uniref:hypothetical protein n=1 Tax=Candidatus Poriferisocius sp. TaxID=3101276 RepID=UPI003B0172A3